MRFVPPQQPAELAPDVVDVVALDVWMTQQGLPDGELTEVRLLTGGTQNILMRFRRGEREYVLRRPPRHLRPRSNDNLRREARVLAALTGSGVAAPALVAACDDETVMGGAAFFLMSAIDGFNATAELPPLHAADPAIRHAMGINAAAELARLGALDHVALGLADFGRPDGFLQRQVPRWLSELDSYVRHDGYPGPDIPGVQQVAAWLEERTPQTFTPGILHGDFHLANLLYAPDGPAVAAIVDWEMCTIGDPLLDLGWLLATWPGDDGAGRILASLAGALGVVGGLPGRAELIDAYAAGSTRDVAAIRWYAVLACFKLGIVLEGTFARACAGKTDRALGERFRIITRALFDRAQSYMEESW